MHVDVSPVPVACMQLLPANSLATPLSCAQPLRTGLSTDIHNLANNLPDNIGAGLDDMESLEPLPAEKHVVDALPSSVCAEPSGELVNIDTAYVPLRLGDRDGFVSPFVTPWGLLP